MATNLPDYVASARPVPLDKPDPLVQDHRPDLRGGHVVVCFLAGTGCRRRAPNAGGTLAAGLGTALSGIILASLICHFLFYLVPGMLGMKTGLPLYIVGTSTYGVRVDFLMPGFVMGVLQFGWIGVNAYGVATLLCKSFGSDQGRRDVRDRASGARADCHLFAIAAAFMGLKGIQYVARVATYFPSFRSSMLLVLTATTIWRRGQLLEPSRCRKWVRRLTASGLLGVIASSARTSSASSPRPVRPGPTSALGNRDARDVQLGGLVGIALATIGRRTGPHHRGRRLRRRERCPHPATT